MVLINYSLLKGTITKDLEDHTKREMTHYNLLVSAGDLEYQVNIDVQSSESSNVKVYCIEDFKNEILDRLNGLGDEGLFKLDDRSRDYQVDYIRSGIFDANIFQKIQPEPWKEISNLLDKHIQVGCKLYGLGEFYNDNDEYIQEHISRYGYEPHGMKLQREHPHLPPRGIHDIHLNQGTPLDMSQHKSNGIYQDGALFIGEPSGGKITAFFFVFSGQSLTTDDQGNPT